MARSSPHLSVIRGSPLLFDLAPSPACCTDHALDELYKALGDPPDESIWAPHHDPRVRDHLEEVTAHGQRLLLDIQNAVFKFLNAEPADELAKAARPWWRRLGADELDALAKRLSDKRPEDYTMDDWRAVVDWVASRYLPDGVIRTEAEYLAVRAVMAGKLAASGVDAERARLALDLVPFTMDTLHGVIKLPRREAAVIGLARERAADLIADIGDRTRHRLRHVIGQWQEERTLGYRDSTLWSLQSRIQDEFAILNRDWRRVALTETARDMNEGFIAALPLGAKVRRVEAYAGACPFCERINGMVFEVVSPDREDKDGWKHVWLGKTNVGRYASPRRRAGSELVERDADEVWWPAAGVQHPNCRGGWVRVADKPQGVDPEFGAWLDKLLVTKQ